MKTIIYRETEDGVQYLNKYGGWSKRSEAVTFENVMEARRFAESQGEDISASYGEA